MHVNAKINGSNTSNKRARDVASPGVTRLFLVSRVAYALGGLRLGVGEILQGWIGRGTLIVRDLNLTTARTVVIVLSFLTQLPAPALLLVVILGCALALP
jgi:hypothetical protein